ncbi:MFS transporter [Nonomuraea phyllanthi]|uniref:MFS transporter n=2 Tax=Nonomuraea phyllanthi TaxID=2219224 RepID=A0A5C4V3I7_9ACTN|nr:MFS transporter [Nonomuraea phyllanthi]
MRGRARALPAHGEPPPPRRFHAWSTLTPVASMPVIWLTFKIMTRVSSAWSIRWFRYVWGAGALSGLGAEIGELALPSLALITLGATAAEASWVRAAMLAPFLLVTLWFGVIVDRRARRPLMIAADLVRGSVLVLVCLLGLTGRLTVPLLVAATAVLGTMTVLYQLSDFSFLPRIVPERYLVDANAKVAATQSAIQIAGSGVGGALVQALTAPVAVVVNALGYLLSALLIGRVRLAEPRPDTPERRSALAEARTGLRTLVRHRILRTLATEAALWNLGNEVFMLALAVHMLDRSAAGPVVLGLIVTCGGVGAFLGSVSSTWLTGHFGYGRSLLASLVIGNTAPLLGVTVAALVPAWAVPALSAAFLLSGAGCGVANSQATSIRQIAVPEEVRGRANAGYRLASWGALSIGALLGGAFTTLLGTVAAEAAGAALMALATLPVALSSVRHVRTIEEVAHRPEPRVPVMDTVSPRE